MVVGRGVRVGFGVSVAVELKLGDGVCESCFAVWVLVAWDRMVLVAVREGIVKFSPNLEISISKGSACEQELSAREKSKTRRNDDLTIVSIITLALLRLTALGNFNRLSWKILLQRVG